MYLYLLHNKIPTRAEKLQDLGHVAALNVRSTNVVCVVVSFAGKFDHRVSEIEIDIERRNKNTK